MSSINNRIKYLVDTYCDSNNSVFANRIGINEANVRNYIKGTEPKFNIIHKIATNFELNFEWLILGIGSPEKDTLKHKTKSTEKLVKKNDQENDQENDQKQKVQKNWSFKDLDINIYKATRKLKYAESLVLSNTGAPFYSDLPVSAGDLQAINNNEHAKGFIDIPGLTCKAYFPVIGTSFKPLIFAGDIIGVDFVDSWEELDTDVIYYVVTNSNRMIKHLSYHETDSETLICSSPNHKEFPISTHEIKKIYKVLFYGRLA